MAATACRMGVRLEPFGDFVMPTKGNRGEQSRDARKSRLRACSASRCARRRRSRGRPGDSPGSADGRRSDRASATARLRMRARPSRASASGALPHRRAAAPPYPCYAPRYSPRLRTRRASGPNRRRAATRPLKSPPNARETDQWRRFHFPSRRLVGLVPGSRSRAVPRSPREA